MAKVKITGHASGTGVITVTAPNTSTDRTITLPDATATIATTTDVAARLPSITDGGNATAMTITSSENVGIGVVPAAWHSSYTALQIGNQGSITQDANVFRLSNNIADTGVNVYIATDEASSFQQTNGSFYFYTAPSGSAGANVTLTNALNITNDGRGLSQFTAKAWVNLNGIGTIAIRDSHNVSSIADVSTGNYTINLTNALANTDFSAVSDASYTAGYNFFDSWENYSFRTTSRTQIRTYSADTYRDANSVSVVIFGD